MIKRWRVYTAPFQDLEDKVDAVNLTVAAVSS
jgi:hypothetical protein